MGRVSYYARNLLTFGAPVLVAANALGGCSNSADGSGMPVTATSGTDGPAAGSQTSPMTPGQSSSPAGVGTPADSGAPPGSGGAGPAGAPTTDPSVTDPEGTGVPQPDATDTTPQATGSGGSAGATMDPIPGGGGSSGGTPAVAGGGSGGSPAGGTGGMGTGAVGPQEPPPLGSWPPPDITLTEYVGGTVEPTAIAAPNGDTTRLFFAEKWGVVRLIKDGALVDEPVLDIREEVLEGGPGGTEGHGTEVVHGGKRGLVGLAFDPNYEENGRAFVLYTADQGIEGYGTNDYNNIYDDGDMTVAQYFRSADNPDTLDPASGEVILQFDKGNCSQCSQHNGGSLEVGVDGFLWASTGDPPPYDNPGSQDLNNLNGKLLRFDISAEDTSADEVDPAGNYPGADPYIWSVGIRNAYKFSIDRYTGDVYVADVGENSWEEVTVERYGDGNKDHGWPKTEGFQTFMAFDGCTEDNCIEPVFDYGHQGQEGTPGADNCIVGGYVYRGSANPGLQGAYFYADYGSGRLRAIQVVDGGMVNGPHLFEGQSVFAGCFGEDANGELYVCDYDNGRILRIDEQ